MSEKQNPRPDQEVSEIEEESDGQDGSLPKSYYYDDSTGYEIYNEETDNDDEEDAS